MTAIVLPGEADWAAFRTAARRLLAEAIPPDTVSFRVDGEGGDLFAASVPPALAAPRADFTVPRAFIDLGETVICHAAPGRFALLYRLLWRLQYDRNLLGDPADADLARATALAKAVRRDMHKMTAFVRFRRSHDEAGDVYVAWFEPEHHIVDATAPFFMRRFAGQRWSILTPKGSAIWDGSRLLSGPPATRTEAPDGDPVEDTWRRYYAAIFNPARLKVKAMLKEMPKKYWQNMPETRLIAGMVAEAGGRAEAMVEADPTAPSAWSQSLRRHPSRRAGPPADTGKAEPDRLAKPANLAEPDSLAEARRQAAGCTRCPLYANATQTVFGEGPAKAPVMLVGEQPGDREDLEGHPFVGPAGQMLARAMDEAGLDRSAIYLTNAVKHFKNEPRGKRRLHKNPSAGEIDTCRWWLDHERRLVAPRLIVAMGGSALRGVTGRTVTVSSLRGRISRLDDGTGLIATVHPSYLLRLPDRDRAAEEYRRFVGDLGEAARFLADAA